MKYKRNEAKEYARRNLKGLWVAITTPFLSGGEIDEAGLRKNIIYFSEGLRIEGIFCNGIMGEFWALTVPERKGILEIIVKESRERMSVSVVTTHHSLRETIELTRHAQEMGAEFAVLTNPYGGPRSERNILSYYRDVCKEVDIGIIIFNTPMAGYSMSPSLIEELVRIENICGIKNTDTTGHMSEVRRRVGTTIVVSDPLEERFFFNMTHFGQQVFYADPEPYLYQTITRQPIREYMESIMKGEVKAALELFLSLNPIRNVYWKWVMNPLLRGEMPNAFLKYWMDLLGMAGGAVRSPLAQITSEQKEALEKDLTAAGLL